MKSNRFLLFLAGALSFGVAVFQATISFVPEWSAAFDAGDELVSNPPLLLTAGLLMALVFGLFGLYGLSSGRVIILPHRNIDSLPDENYQPISRSPRCDYIAYPSRILYNMI